MAFRPAPLDQDRYEKLSIFVQFTELQIFFAKGFVASANAFSLGKILFGKCAQIITKFLDYLCFYLLSTSEQNG